MLVPNSSGTLNLAGNKLKIHPWLVISAVSNRKCCYVSVLRNLWARIRGYKFPNRANPLNLEVTLCSYFAWISRKKLGMMFCGESDVCAQLSCWPQWSCWRSSDVVELTAATWVSLCRHALDFAKSTMCDRWHANTIGKCAKSMSSY